MQSYQAARTYFSLLEILAWCVIVFGAIVAIVAWGAVGQMSRGFGGSPIAGIAGLVPGVAVMFLGFLGLAGAQVGRAAVDSAEYTQQGLKVARDQLDVSRQALKHGAVLEKGYAALQAAKEDLRRNAEPASAPVSASYADAQPGADQENVLAGPPIKTIDYRGRQIEKRTDGYYVGPSHFAGLNGAQRNIDRTIDEAVPVPSATGETTSLSEQTSDAATSESGGGTRA